MSHNPLHEDKNPVVVFVRLLWEGLKLCRIARCVFFRNPLCMRRHTVFSITPISIWFPPDCVAKPNIWFWKDSAQILHAAFVFLFFSALNFAHRAFVAFPIFALAAADITRFLT